MDEDAYVYGTGRTSLPNPRAKRRTRPWQPRRAFSRKATIRRRIAIIAPNIVFGSLLLLVIVGFGGAVARGEMLWATIPLTLLFLGMLGLMLFVFLQIWVVGKCPRCKAQLAPTRTFSLRKPRWCSRCSYLVNPQGLANKFGPGHDFSEWIKESDPAVKLLMTLFLNGLNQGVDEVHLEPGDEDYRYYHVTSGRVDELEPPWPNMHRELAMATRAIWHGDPYDQRPFSRAKEIDAYRTRALVEASVDPTPYGEHLCFRLTVLETRDIQRVLSPVEGAC